MDYIQLKNEMMQAVSFVRGELDAFRDSLTLEEKARRGSLQSWSASDVVTHLTFWEEHLNRVIKNGMRGEKIPSAGDYLDQVNDGVLLEHINQPFEDALTEEAAAYNQFIAFIKGVSAVDVIDPKKYAFLDGDTLLDRTLGTYIYHAAFHISDFYIKNGQQEKALKLQIELTDQLIGFPNWKANTIYNLACFFSLNGMKKEAIEQLKLAFQEKPELLEWSKQDSDIDPLRGEAEFQALFN